MGSFLKTEFLFGPSFSEV